MLCMCSFLHRFLHIVRSCLHLKIWKNKSKRLWNCNWVYILFSPSIQTSQNIKLTSTTTSVDQNHRNSCCCGIIKRHYTNLKVFGNTCSRIHYKKYFKSHYVANTIIYGKWTWNQLVQWRKSKDIWLGMKKRKAWKIAKNYVLHISKVYECFFFFFWKNTQIQFIENPWIFYANSLLITLFK